MGFRKSRGKYKTIFFFYISNFFFFNISIFAQNLGPPSNRGPRPNWDFVKVEENIKLFFFLYLPFFFYISLFFFNVSIFAQNLGPPSNRGPRRWPKWPRPRAGLVHLLEWLVWNSFYLILYSQNGHLSISPKFSSKMSIFWNYIANCPYFKINFLKIEFQWKTRFLENQVMWNQNNNNNNNTWNSSSM